MSPHHRPAQEGPARTVGGGGRGEGQIKMRTSMDLVCSVLFRTALPWRNLPGDWDEFGFWTGICRYDLQGIWTFPRLFLGVLWSNMFLVFLAWISSVCSEWRLFVHFFLYLALYVSILLFWPGLLCLLWRCDLHVLSLYSGCIPIIFRFSVCGHFLLSY